MNSPLKRCPGYRREPHLAPEAMFAIGRTNRDGLQKRCRPCHSAAMKARRGAIKIAPKVRAETKRCARCARVGRSAIRLSSEFHEAADTLDGKRNHCKDCVRELRWITWGIADMTVERFASILEEQGGRCAIPSCGVIGTAERCLDVDHDHATGEVRGLLCRNCNVALGKVRESTAILHDMVTYLATLR